MHRNNYSNPYGLSQFLYFFAPLAAVAINIAPLPGGQPGF
jgi:hypothetical protein